MSSFVPDCLVLKIEEYTFDTNELDNTIYVLYDKKKQYFVVRGQRATNEMDSCVFSFICKNVYDLANFLSFVVCTKNKWTYVLYNYDNLPYMSDNITYEFLKEHDSKVYELSGYELRKYNRDELIGNLKMLKNVFNYYN